VFLYESAVDERGELRFLVGLHHEAAWIVKDLRFDQHDFWNIEPLESEWHAPCSRANQAATTPQTCWLTWRIRSSFRHWSASVIRLPCAVLAKPHCGLMHRRSTGTYREASAIRRAMSATGSRAGDLVVTRPSTITLSSGTNRSGSNVPERS